VTFEVRVKPRARRDEATGILDGRLAVSITAPPAEGAANEALVRFLARALGIARRDVRIARGHRSRVKLVEVPAEVRERLLAIPASR